MKITAILTGAAVLAASVSGAWAGAMVEGSPTGVRAMSTNGTVAVLPGADVPAGTRLIVGRAAAGVPAANTELRFSDGCAVSLKPGQVFTVGEASPCTFNAQGTPEGDNSLFGGGSIAPVIIGTVVVGGIVAGVVAATSSKSNNRQVPYLSY